MSEGPVPADVVIINPSSLENQTTADFGFSAIKMSHDNEYFKTSCGTKSYMAPEVLCKLQYSGGPVDIWSAGVVIFIMLTGNPPFVIANMSDWWFKALNAGRIDNFWRAHERSAPVLTYDAKAFLMRMLVPNPEGRASIQELMSSDWLNSGTMSELQLRDEMAYRKKTVDEKKR